MSLDRETGYDPEIDRQRLEDDAIEEQDFDLITEEIARFAKLYGMGRTLLAVAYVAEHPEIYEHQKEQQ